MSETLYLAHHGIKGQEWGVRNGPPYPLSKNESYNANKASKTLKNISKTGVGLAVLSVLENSGLTTSAVASMSALGQSIVSILGPVGAGALVVSGAAYVGSKYLDRKYGIE